MRPNTHIEQFYFEKRRQRDELPIATELWLLYFLGLALAVLFSTYAYTGQENLCDPLNTGTDYWYEVCLNQGEIDLGAEQEPTVQDEVDTAISTARNI